MKICRNDDEKNFKIKSRRNFLNRIKQKNCIFIEVRNTFNSK